MNRLRPHVVVIPEDDANRQIANGFLLQPSIELGRIQILGLAGGWTKVRQAMIDGQARMKKYSEQRVIGLVDFDNCEARKDEILPRIDESLHERIFILGALGTPEQLKKALGSFEAIGKALARDCANGTSETWSHPLLDHNAAELERVQADIVPFLFGR